MRLAELQHLAPQIHELLGRFGASNVAVFGSVARDQARPESDIDLLVDLPEGASLFDRAELKSALELARDGPCPTEWLQLRLLQHRQLIAQKLSNPGSLLRLPSGVDCKHGHTRRDLLRVHQSSLQQLSSDPISGQGH